MTKPIVSVVVPMFGAEATIADTLSSLAAQSETRWEAVVVNDGSTDQGPGIARAWAGSDQRVRVIDRPNGGLSAARNTGIEHSRGEWLVFLDADDWMLRNGIGALLAGARASAHGMVCAGTRWRDESGHDLGWSQRPGLAGIGLEELLDSNRFQVHGVMVRRSTLGEVRFDCGLTSLEDWDLWLRLCGGRGGSKRRFAVIDADVGAYRLRAGSMSRHPRRMAGNAARVLSGAFSRARGEGLGALASVERERGSIARFALGAAAATCVGTGGEAGTAREILSAHTDREWVTPENAAHAACWMIPFAACMTPRSWNERPVPITMVRAAEEFFAAVSDFTGREPGGFRMEYLSALGAESADAEMVAARLVQRCRGESRVVLCGVGRNGAAVGGALREAGIGIDVIDDAIAQGTRELEIGGCVARVLGKSAPLDAGRVYIVTPARDTAFLQRLPDGARVLTWGAQQRRCAEEFVRHWPVHADAGMERAA